jgi:hypothetical protein
MEHDEKDDQHRNERNEAGEQAADDVEIEPSHGCGLR